MFSYHHFTAGANKALNLAVESAQNMGHTYIGSEHILLGLVCEGSGVAAAELASKGVSITVLKSAVKQNVGIGSVTRLRERDLTPRARSIIDRAKSKSMGTYRNTVGTEHILLSILNENDCMALRILREIGVSPASILGDLLGAGESAAQLKQKTTAPRANTLLVKYGRDLTQLAACGQIPPAIGREKDASRCIRTQRLQNVIRKETRGSISCIEDNVQPRERMRLIRRRNRRFYPCPNVRSVHANHVQGLNP